MALTETGTISPVGQLILDLKQELNRELAAGQFEQARQLVDAISLADQKARGKFPDITGHPLHDRLETAFKTEDVSPLPPSQQVHLSASSMGDFERCSLMYKFKHVEHIPSKEESSPAAVFGNVIHRVMETYHAAEGDTDRPTLLETLELHWNPSDFAYRQQADQNKADAQKVLTQYEAYLAAQQYPQTTLAVEHPFKFRLGDAEIRGKIDHVYATESGGFHLIDYKTSKKKMSEKAANDDLQLAVYAIYCEQAKEEQIGRTKLGRLPDAVTYFYVRDDEPEVTIKYSDEALLAHRDRIEEITASIRQGDFEATNDDHICTYCDYKDLICPKWER